MNELTRSVTYTLVFIVVFFQFGIAQDRQPEYSQFHELYTSDLIKDGIIDLIQVRKITNFLTDDNIECLKGKEVPNRKKAVKRHVKQLSEPIEIASFDSIQVDSALYWNLYQLRLYELSFKQKTLSQDVNVGLGAKFGFLYQTVRSRFAFRYKITEDGTIAVSSPDSLFRWTGVLSDEAEDRFDELANLKKIEPNKTEIVIFDEFSYSGSVPKLKVHDTDMDEDWVLKWGDEIHADIAGSRLFAALGYDVDHPYYFGPGSLYLLFPPNSPTNNFSALQKQLQDNFKVDITMFLLEKGVVTDSLCERFKRIAPYKGWTFVTFLKCGLEGRPDRVKRLGTALTDQMGNPDRPELKEALLAHMLIDNWDTRDQNTLLSQVHFGNHEYRSSAVFSDLGTSFGVVVRPLKSDFKVGLVNHFDWEFISSKKGRIIIHTQVNGILAPYLNAEYDDLKRMAHRIAQLDSACIASIINEAHWPEPLRILYFNKLASRRANVLETFGIDDPDPIKFDRYVNYEENGILYVKDGVLIKEYEPELNPEGFIGIEGRKRNYGY